MANPYEAPKTDAQLRRDACCSFCEESYRDAGPLVEGPDLSYICGKCCDDAIAGHVEMKGARSAGRWCSYCRKESSITGALVTAASGATICVDCTDLVRQILDQEILRRMNRKQT